MVYSPTYFKIIALGAMLVAAAPASTAQYEAADITCEVSAGDQSVGIRAVADTSCAEGGLGCYSDHCRYCKILDTPKSSHLDNCTSLGADFPTMAPLVVSTGPCEVSEGDAAAGVAAVVDEDCLYGGIGCFSDHCRFCKVEETEQSTAFLNCTNFNAANLVTGTSSSWTPVATDATSTATTPTPVVTDAPASDATCALVVSSGDAEVGINIVSDASCSSGGVGCIDSVCRFCRVWTTLQSAAFVSCDGYP